MNASVYLNEVEKQWLNLVKEAQTNFESEQKNTTENGGVKYDINGKSGKLVDIYTEEQYNNYGWATANNVWSTAERETIFSRYADFKHNKDKYPITRFGEVVINSSEHPNIIAYVKGNIKNPKVTKIIRINAQNELLSEISKEILHNERRQISLPNENVIDLFGEEILTNSKRKDYAPFQEYKTRRQRSNSQKSNSDNKQLKNGSGNLQSNKENDRADGLTPAFSMPEKSQVKYSIPDDSEKIDALWDEKIEKYGAIDENAEIKTPKANEKIFLTNFCKGLNSQSVFIFRAAGTPNLLTIHYNLLLSKNRQFCF